MQEQGQVVDNLLQNFDPKDTTYKRLFFEITGRNLTPGEFDDDDSEEIIDDSTGTNNRLQNRIYNMNMVNMSQSVSENLSALSQNDEPD